MTGAIARMSRTARNFTPAAPRTMPRRGSIIVFFLLTGLLIPPGFAQLTGTATLANEPLVKLSETEVNQQLQSLPDWTIEDQQLRRTYQFEDFVEAVAFVNRLVEPAETAGHHPDIAISFNQVAIALTTHDAGGITQQDFDLAQVISQIAAHSSSPSTQ